MSETVPPPHLLPHLRTLNSCLKWPLENRATPREGCQSNVSPCWRKSKKLSRVVETQRPVTQWMAMRHQATVMQAKGQVSRLDPEQHSQRVIQNFGSLFWPYPARSVPGSSSSARNNSYRPAPPKKPKEPKHTGFLKWKKPANNMFSLAIFKFIDNIIKGPNWNLWWFKNRHTISVH